tara:strand:+ start:226 stop:435 length:210 start_codon:yes stop_codon:yes gene_type:complete
MKVTYENWRGVVSERNIELDYLHLGRTEHHITTQWLLRCRDLDTGEVHDFSMNKIAKINANQLRFRSEL